MALNSKKNGTLSFARLLAALLCLWLPNILYAQELEEVSIKKYELHLEPDLVEKSVAGTVHIHIERNTTNQSSIALNSGDLGIIAVKLDGEQTPYRKDGDILIVDLPSINNNLEQEIQIVYQGTPTYGIKFSESGNEVSTAFSTGQWMPSIDAPSNRASFEISLTLPENFLVAASGNEISSNVLADGKQISTWSETQYMPAYLYGFAAGEFREVLDNTDEPALRYLTPPDFSEYQISQIFKDTRSAIAFFEDKSGMSYPNDVYTQVLLRNGSGQELNVMAVMSERYGVGVLSDETAIWLGVHELAHQWWGNMVTNLDWTHFWLNEGLVNFMTAAYLGHRFGATAYESNISAAQEQYLKLAETGHDKPLVFPNWDNPSREDRSIVYDKGVYAIHLLKELIGEEAFWSGIKSYTFEHWGKSVTTVDLQNAMEQASGRNLDNFFDSWAF